LKIPAPLNRNLPIPSRLAYAAAILLALFLFDISRLPQNQLTAKFLLYTISLYQQHISQRLTGVVQCKFQPTCSHYGKASIERYGAFWGTIRTARRLYHCSPWSSRQGYDPP
jgi:hypothetical protein